MTNKHKEVLLPPELKLGSLDVVVGDLARIWAEHPAEERREVIKSVINSLNFSLELAECLIETFDNKRLHKPIKK